MNDPLIQSLRQALRGYGQHPIGCPRWRGKISCTCGLDDVLESYRRGRSRALALGRLVMRGGRKDTVRAIARQHAASFRRRRRRRYHAAQHARRSADVRATRKTFWVAVLFFAAWLVAVCLVR